MISILTITACYFLVEFVIQLVLMEYEIGQIV